MRTKNREQPYHVVPHDTAAATTVSVSSDTNHMIATLAHRHGFTSRDALFRAAVLLLSRLDQALPCDCKHGGELMQIIETVGFEIKSPVN